MRKMLSLLLALCMLCSLCTAFAAEIKETGSQSSDMTVMYGVDAYYTINIPEEVTIDTETKTGEATLSISNVVLPSGSVLVIELNSAAARDGKWYLTSSAAQQLEYTITSKIVGTIEPGDYYYCEAGLLAGQTLTDLCTLALVDDVPFAGVYTDLITYTVSVVHVTPTRQCYVCAAKYTWSCDVCASEAECTHVCAQCYTCPDCFYSDTNDDEWNTFYHCPYCDECIFMMEQHAYCDNCQKCVNEPDYCYSCKLCDWCDENH